MSEIKIRETIKRIEADVAALKRLVRREPDFTIDEANWQKVRPIVKKVRKENYRRTLWSELRFLLIQAF